MIVQVDQLPGSQVVAGGLHAADVVGGDAVGTEGDQPVDGRGAAADHVVDVAHECEVEVMALPQRAHVAQLLHLTGETQGDVVRRELQNTRIVG